MKLWIGFSHRNDVCRNHPGQLPCVSMNASTSKVPRPVHRFSSDSRPLKSMGAASSVSVLICSGWSAAYDAASVPPMQ